MRLVFESFNYLFSCKAVGILSTKQIEALSLINQVGIFGYIYTTETSK